MSERALYKEHPSMFRNDPITFIICLASIPALGTGLLFEWGWLLVLSPLFVVATIWLVIWWVITLNETLTVDDQKVVKRTGIFAKHETEIYHADACNIRIDQSFLQRIFDAGDLIVASAATGGVEINVKGLPHPEKAKRIIEGYHQDYLNRWRPAI